MAYILKYEKLARHCGLEAGLLHFSLNPCSGACCLIRWQGYIRNGKQSSKYDPIKDLIIRFWPGFALWVTPWSLARQGEVQNEQA